MRKVSPRAQQAQLKAAADREVPKSDRGRLQREYSGKGERSHEMTEQERDKSSHTPSEDPQEFTDAQQEWIESLINSRVDLPSAGPAAYESAPANTERSGTSSGSITGRRLA